MHNDNFTVFNKSEFNISDIDEECFKNGLHERRSDGKLFYIKKGSNRGIMTEYIMGGIYKKLLGENCPDIIIIKVNKEGHNNCFLWVLRGMKI